MRKIKKIRNKNTLFKRLIVEREVKTVSNEEYIDLMNELEEQAPSMEGSLDKAKKRKMRKQVMWHNSH